MFYKIIELEEGVLVQYVGTYVTKVGGPPTVGFIEATEEELAAASQNKLFCEWTNDFDYLWGSSCDYTFFLDDGMPEENGFNFCPKCGNRVLVVEEEEEEE